MNTRHHQKLDSQQHRTKRYKTERDVLIENHRFLRTEEDDKELTWEKRVSKKYYDKLYKEYALIELKYYKEGRVAMRWRNENELLRGKGEYTCGSLGCDVPDGLQSWEVNFGYVEKDEKKNALVKVRLCEQCSVKLNYKKKHKLVENTQDNVTHRHSKGYSDKKKKRKHSDESRSRSRERRQKRDAEISPKKG